MRRPIVFALSCLPVAALAHPDHTSGAYSVAHYLTGSHAAVVIGIGVIAVVAMRVLWRRFVR